MHEIPENLGVIDAYDDRITNEYGFTYISDSGMKWRQKGAVDYLGKERLYILTHPETWYSKSYNLIQLHRHIQQHETNKLRRKFNEYVEGNIGYLKQRFCPTVRHLGSQTAEARCWKSRRLAKSTGWSKVQR